MKKDLFTIGIILLSLAILSVGCRKLEDPPIPVGQSLPYKSSKPTDSLVQLLDSLPQTTIYKAAWQRADLQHYIDSLRGKDTLMPFTLFVPTDSAFKQAGITIDTVNSMPVAQLDSLLRYLALSGNITYDTIPVTTGTTTYYPLMYPNPAFVTPGLSGAAYFYKLTVGAYNNTLYLNGKPVSGHSTPISASDGSIFLIDSIISRPRYTTAEILSSDTSYSFYWAACYLSDSIYNYQQIYGFPYDDTSYLYFDANAYSQGQDGWTVVFAPDNNAFRKAGFSSIDDIRNYVDTSAINLENFYANPFLSWVTNLDSILVNHRLLYNIGGYQLASNVGKSYLYTVDMLHNPYTQSLGNNPTVMGGIFFQYSSGQVVIHRQDFPNGRAAHVIAPYDVTTLTGVIHRVDNLLLPTP